MNTATKENPAAVYIEVCAEVRYWEDATVNGEEDKDGKLIPCREGRCWTPTIRLADGVVMDWPQGTTADVHFKVCDAGEYWLLDENRERIGKWSGFYVPNDFLCHGDTGYGDYIIFKVDGAGSIEEWSVPDVVWACSCAGDEDDDRGWTKLEGHA